MQMVIVEVTEQEVRCAGGEEPHGHPAVFLNLGQNGQVACPYCGKRFIRAQQVKGRESHA